MKSVSIDRAVDGHMPFGWHKFVEGDYDSTNTRSGNGQFARIERVNSLQRSLIGLSNTCSGVPSSSTRP